MSQRSPSFVVPLSAVGALLVLSGGWAAFAYFRGQAAQAEARHAALLAVDAAVAVRPADLDELGRCMAALRKLPEVDTDRELRLAAARIELARDRAEIAEGLCGSLAAEPAATVVEQRLAARILLRRHEADLGDDAVGALRTAQQFSERAYAADRLPGDLFRAWLAAMRAEQFEDGKRFAEQLQQQHPDSAEWRFVDVARGGSRTSGVAGVEACRDGLDDLPGEHGAMLAGAQLEAGQVPVAVASADLALSRAPGLVVVRRIAAVAYHTCVLGSPADSVDRADWVRRRDVQLDWLERQPRVDDPQRAKLREMRAVR